MTRRDDASHLSACQMARKHPHLPMQFYRKYGKGRSGAHDLVTFCEPSLPLTVCVKSAWFEWKAVGVVKQNILLHVFIGKGVEFISQTNYFLPPRMEHALLKRKKTTKNKEVNE